MRIRIALLTLFFLTIYSFGQETKKEVTPAPEEVAISDEEFKRIDYSLMRAENFELKRRALITEINKLIDERDAALRGFDEAMIAVCKSKSVDPAKYQFHQAGKKLILKKENP